MYLARKGRGGIFISARQQSRHAAFAGCQSESAKGAARTSRPSQEPIASRSVLREFFESAQGLRGPRKVKSSPESGRDRLRRVPEVPLKFLRSPARRTWKDPLLSGRIYEFRATNTVWYPSRPGMSLVSPASNRLSIRIARLEGDKPSTSSIGITVERS